MARLERARRVYTTLAIVFTNAVVLFVLVNALATRLEKPPSLPQVLEIGPLIPKAYPGRAPAELAQLLQETWTRPLEFSAFTVFKEAPFQGRFVNVSPHGFRLVKDQGPWPLDPRFTNVFVFGGSTTFGYGVADDETVPSFLQQALARIGLAKPPRVYNFACGFYYSTQERILFERLVTRGATPDAAIFVDGLNDFLYPADEPHLAEECGEAILARRRGPTWGEMLAALPVARAARSRATPAPPPSPRMPTAAEIASVVSRHAASRKLIEAAAERVGVRAVFVWQPVPSWEYDLSYHIFAPLGLHGAEACGPGYAAMLEHLRRSPPGPSFLWLADLQKGVKAALYVDRIHYNPTLAKGVADQVAALVKERKLLE